MKQIFYRHQHHIERTPWFRTLRHICFIWMGLLYAYASFAQPVFEQTAPSKYRIVFKDKENSGYSINDPESFLSARALERRSKQGIEITENDLPVVRAYIDSLTEAGARVLHVSKWFNAATIQVPDDSVLDRIATYSFVRKDYIPAQAMLTGNVTVKNTQSAGNYNEMNYGPSWWQTAIHKGHVLHNSGFTGKGIVIAVIDAGFSNADTLAVFNRLFENGRILGTRDFVEPGNDVYRASSHGMAVLSVIGGYNEHGLIGTAPDASFWLLRSEDGSSEYIIEEDNWIAAAEFADSAGADIINTSLGYSEFNDPFQNHTYADMDGNTTRISRAADIAASKGMMVIVSAGNQGNNRWRYITAPADADSALAIGAIDRSGLIAYFSSRGPSSDNQVKPDVVALGQGVYVADNEGGIRPGNGTSFAAPVISGLTACLWQANPDATAYEIFNAIRESADRFYYPDDEYGYGIPDFNFANILLNASRPGQELDARVIAFPNPFYDQLYVFFKTPVNGTVNVRLFDLAGKEVFHKTWPEVQGRKFLVIDNEFDGITKGMYIIRITSDNISGNSKLIRY